MGRLRVIAGLDPALCRGDGIPLGRSPGRRIVSLRHSPGHSALWGIVPLGRSPGHSALWGIVPLRRSPGRSALRGIVPLRCRRWIGVSHRLFLPVLQDTADLLHIVRRVVQGNALNEQGLIV